MSLRRTLDFIEAHPILVLTTHESADADGLGAEFALAKGLKGLGKECSVLNGEPVPEIYSFIDADGLVAALPRGVRWMPPPADCGIIVLDTNDFMNVPILAGRRPSDTPPVCIVDHHEGECEDAAMAWIDKASSSTCEMVFNLLSSLGAPLGPDMATSLFAGISYDTGSFIYQRTTEATFAAARDLVRAGASPAMVHSRLHESGTVGALLLMRLALDSLALESGGRMAVQTLPRGAFESTGARYEDAEELINVPLRAREIEVSILFKESPQGSLRCSMRSKGAVNVALVAQRFGGGGHRTAAGFKCRDGLEAAKASVAEAFREILDGGR